MTKLEAWQAWSATAGTADLATEFTLENSSHGKAFSFAWDAAVKAEREECAQVAKQWDIDHPSTNYGGCIAAAIRSRGE